MLFVAIYNIRAGSVATDKSRALGTSLGQVPVCRWIPRIHLHLGMVSDALPLKVLARLGKKLPRTDTPPLLD